MDIEIPKESKIDGPLRGDVLFTTSFKATSWEVPPYGRLKGFGFLDMDDVADFDSENQWLIDLLKEAATTDGAGSDSQLLIECIGRYEDPDGDGDISDGSSLAYKAGLPKSSWYTYSYHADWIRNNYSKIYVKADWEVELVDGYYEITIQPYVSHRPDDGFDNWQCNFVRNQYSVPLYIEQQSEDDGGSEYLYIDIWFGNSNKDSDGNERWPDVQASSGASGTSDAAEADVIDQMTPYLMDYLDSSRRMGLSGWQNIEPPDENSLNGLLGGSWHSKKNDYGEDITYKVFTAKLYGEHTNDDQVYSCQFTAKVPADITFSVNKTIANKSNYSNNFWSLPEYKLSGTKFLLYTSETGSERVQDTDGNNAEITITNDAGGIYTIKLPYSYANSTIWLEEVLPTAATGFKKPATRYSVKLPDAGGSIVKDIENEPIVDPALLSIKKISPQTNSGKPAADIHYEGIEYTLAYFGERSSSQSNAGSNTGAINTWKFETNEFGRIDFTDDDYFVSGHALYIVEDAVQYPVGWYRIWESSPSNVVQDKGLEVSKHFYCVHIKNDDNDTFDIFIDGTTTEYKNPHENTASTEIEETREGKIFEPEHWEPFAFVKKDIYLASGKPEGDAQLEGAVFTVYSEDPNRFADLKDSTYDGHTYSIGSGNVVLVDGNELTITIDSDGRGICKYPLPKTDNTIGKRFYITETTAPLGYKANDVKYYVDFQNTITVKDYNDNTISLSIKNIETGTTSNETEIYSITYGANNLNVNEVSVPYVNGTAYNTPRKGIIEIEKFDDDYGAVRNKYFFVQFAEKI